MHRCRSTVLLLALCTLLHGCGGGGSGGGATGGGAAGGGAGGGGATPSLYGGSEAQATLSSTNAVRFVGVVFDSSALGDGFTPATTAAPSGTKAKPGTSGELSNLPRIAQRIHQRAITSALGELQPEGAGFQIAVRIDETENCSVSGTARTTGEVDDNGIGTVTVNFSACRDGDGMTTIAGVTRLTVRSRLGVAGATVGDATTIFDDLTLTLGPDSFRLQGRIDVRRTLANEETTTINLTTRDNASNTAIDLRNYVVTRVFLVGEPGAEERYAGRLYLSDLGFVDVSTSTGFVFSNAEATTPDRRGRLLLGGAGGSRVEFGIVSDDASRLRLDANGDGTFETSVALAFAALTDATGTDLADSDGDGMHNSWERAYGLDPSDAADADRDPDGDGASNRQEHLGLGRPDRADILPRGPSDLAVTLTRISPATADTGSVVRLRLRLENLGPRRAVLPVVRLAVSNGGAPSEVDTNYPFACTVSQSCGLELLEAGESRSTTIEMASGSIGTDTVLTATASARSIDPAPGNDSATVATPVRELSLSTISLEHFAQGSIVYAPSLGEFVGTSPGVGGALRVLLTSPRTAAVRSLDIMGVATRRSELPAITSDASTLYVASTRDRTIERIDIASGTVGQSAFASSDTVQILTIPGRNGDLVALSRMHLEYFRDGVTLHIGAAAPSAMALSSDARFLYLLAYEFPRYVLRRYPIIDSGLGEPTTIPIADTVGPSVLGVGGGVVVLGNGAVLDEVTGVQRGSIGTVGNSLLLADGASGRIYVVQRFTPGVEPGMRLRVFDIATLALLHDVDLPFSCEELHRWGEDGLACRTVNTLEFGQSAVLVRQ